MKRATYVRSASGKVAALLSALAFTACHGAKTVTAVPVTVHPAEAQARWRDASTVLSSRCAVCHGCYDAPCQLKLDAYEGATRGASHARIYDAARLLAATPTRLFIDATTTQGWREHDFYPVLPEGDQRDPAQSLLLRMLALKRAHPLPAVESGISTEAFDLGIEREQVCPKADAFDDYAKEHPLWGMPYGLQGLSEAEHQALVAWVQVGAPAPTRPALEPALAREVEHWESLLNGASNKQRLVARYIYEHLFFGSLYFADVSDQAWFRLVRSRTPPGQAVDEIATRRPFDDPGAEPFYYRFVQRHELRLAKRQMPYALDAKRMARFADLFFTPDYAVSQLPSYDAQVSANPFKAFAALPARSRYRFLLDEAEYTLMGFIKGPVCHGQTALNVIQDRFWLTFVDPDVPWLEQEADFLAHVQDDLDLPAEDGSTSLLVSWFSYSAHQRDYLKRKAAFIRGEITSGAEHSLRAIWDGDGTNDNAALTVFRHFDNATVEKGLLGGPPKTAWVLGYALLERIHYLLVAGFDVFGNVGHQLNTRLYMDFLRMEGEHNFLLLLPRTRRSALVDAWYRDVDDDVKNEVYGAMTDVPYEPSIEYRTDRPELELYQLLEERLVKIRSKRSELSRIESASLREPLERLGRVHGPAASLLPETSFVMVTRAGGGPAVHVTVTRDSAHTNVAHLFRERALRLPQEDELTVTYGFLGEYPNALFAVDEAALPAFVSAVEALHDAAGYRALRERFGVLRNAAQFWPHSDRIHRDFQRLEPLRYGWFDFNRLDPL